MRTVHVPNISGKRVQTYDEAMRAIALPYTTAINKLEPNELVDRTVYLRDITRRHYTEELILAALKNHKCQRFNEIPENFRTETVYIAAMECYEGNMHFIKSVIAAIPPEKWSRRLCLAILKLGRPYMIQNIPPEYFKQYEFAMMAVSWCPRAVETVLTLYRDDRENAGLTHQDMKIVVEAMCPRARGKAGFDRLLEKGKSADEILKGRTFEQFCAEEYGYLPAKYQFDVCKAVMQTIEQDETSAAK